jgi:hypothetical protein
MTRCAKECIRAWSTNMREFSRVNREMAQRLRHSRPAAGGDFVIDWRASELIG